MIPLLFLQRRHEINLFFFVLEQRFWNSEAYLPRAGSMAVGSATFEMCARKLNQWCRAVSVLGVELPSHLRAKLPLSQPLAVDMELQVVLYIKKVADCRLLVLFPFQNVTIGWIAMRYSAVEHFSWTIL